MPVAYKETVSGIPYIKIALSMSDIEELVMFIWTSKIADRTLRVDQIATLLNECYAAHMGADVTDDFEWLSGAYLDDPDEDDPISDPDDDVDPEEDPDDEEGEEDPDTEEGEDPEYEIPDYTDQGDIRR